MKIKKPLGQQGILQEEETDNLCLQRYCKAHIFAGKISCNNIAEAQQEVAINPLCTQLLFLQPKNVAQNINAIFSLKVFLLKKFRISADQIEH